MSRLGAAALGIALAVGGAACERQPDVERQVLLVSGRDDHGALATPTVELLDGPDGGAVASVADDTLVRVLDTAGEWLEVATLEADPAQGWLNDFHLRGTVHAVGADPACPVPAYVDGDTTGTVELLASEQVELVDVHDHDGESWVRVRSVSRAGVTAFVRREVLQELPGPVARPGVACAVVPPLPEASPHRH